MFENKKILITGGSGSLGRALIKRLLEKNVHSIRVFSRNEIKQIEMQLEFENDPRLRFLIGDVRDLPRLERAMEDIDMVFHAAALKQVPSCEFYPIEAVKTNIIGTCNLIFCCEEKNIKLEEIIGEKSLGEILITPTEIYTLDCLALIRGMKDLVHAFSHITGGGLAENTARVIPGHLTATFDRSTWSLPLGMEYLAEVGQVPQKDLERTWNAGIGMVAIVDSSAGDLALKSLAARGMQAWVAGVVQKSTGVTATLEGSYRPR